MPKKLLKSRKAAAPDGNKGQTKQPLTLQQKRASRRNIAVLSVLILLTFCLAAVAHWRNLSVFNRANSSFNSSGALVTGIPPAMPADKPGKEFVYAGSSLLATVEPFRQPPDDFAVWRPGNGVWYVLNFVNGQQQAISYQFGSGATDIPAPGDFDGDGKADFCVFRPADNTWFIVHSSTDTVHYAYLGGTGDLPAIADYDGDGRDDVGIFRPSNGTWYVQPSAGGAATFEAFGQNGDKPVPGDFDGDGETDLAIWRDSIAQFWVRRSSDGQQVGFSFGQTGDEPVIGDYDGDGIFDYATRRLVNGAWQWNILPSSTGTAFNLTWGAAEDFAVQGDYDRDGKTDIAVWRPSNGVWYVNKSSDGTMLAVQFGMSGDIPVPAPYRR